MVAEFKGVWNLILGIKKTQIKLNRDTYFTFVI